MRGCADTDNKETAEEWNLSYGSTVKSLGGNYLGVEDAGVKLWCEALGFGASTSWTGAGTSSSDSIS